MYKNSDSDHGKLYSSSKDNLSSHIAVAGLKMPSQLKPALQSIIDQQLQYDAPCPRP